MRKLIIVVALIFAYTQTKGLLHSLKEPAAYQNGVYWCGKDYKYNPSTGLCVPIFEELGLEVASTETSTATSATVSNTHEPEIAEEVFVPLNYSGKVGKFAKEHGGTIIKIKDHRKWSKISHYKIPYKSKGVQVGDDFYWTAKDGTNYVIHKGKLIKI